MQSDISLNEPFYYANYPLVIVILLIIITIIILLCLNINKEKKPKDKPIVAVKKDINSIKNKYLKELDDLSRNIHIFSKRKIYNILSQTIRSFVLETTNVDVLKYSLNEIKTLNIDSLTELVEEYYEPEFNKESNANPITSINKTKEVIKKWK